jgi:tetratricopeptide (TPR) repeat protein
MKAKDEGAKAVFGLLPDLSAKYPDILTRQRISGLAELFADQERYPEAIAFLEFIYKENPASGRAAADLARACLSAGELERAKTLYLKAKEAKQDKANIRNIDWDLDYLQAVQSPAPLEESYMQALAGDYDVRHITVKDGMLYYFREGGTSAAPRRLLPLSRDTFFIEGVIYFRIKVEFDDQGRPAKLIGLYDNGNGDESLRNK